MQYKRGFVVSLILLFFSITTVTIYAQGNISVGYGYEYFLDNIGVGVTCTFTAQPQNDVVTVPSDSDGDIRYYVLYPDGTSINVNCVRDSDGASVRQDQLTVVIDTDGDGVSNSHDNCPVVINPDQGDNDGDGLGNACDATPNNGGVSGINDADSDGVINSSDNCPTTYNPDQADSDRNGIGDACDGVVPTAIPTATIIMLPNHPANICARNSNVNIRSGPSINFSIVGSLMLGEIAEVIGAGHMSDHPDEVWYQIAPSGNWVAGSVSTTGDGCALPGDYDPTLDTGGVSFAPENILVNCPSDVGAQAGTLPDGIIYGYSDQVNCDSLARTWSYQSEHGDRLLPRSESTLYAECSGEDHGAVIPSFIDLVNSLDPATRSILDDFLKNNDPCAFATALIRDHELIDLPLTFTIEDAVNLITLSCQPYATGPVRMATVNEIIAMHPNMELEDIFANVNVCTMVDVLNVLGPVTSDQPLYDWFHSTCNLPADEALELVLYAVSIGVNTDELANAGVERCSDYVSSFSDERISLEELAPEDILAINTIAGALETCMTQGNELFVNVMVLWARWEDLSQSERDRLLGYSDPCAAVIAYLTTGAIPAEQVNAVLPPPDNNFAANNLPATSDEPPIIGNIPVGTTRALFITSDSNIVNATGILLAQIEGETQASLRVLHEGELEPVGIDLGTGNIQYPLLDSAGESIAYLADGELRQVSLHTGRWISVLTSTRLQPIGLEIAPLPFAWSPDNRFILLTLINHNNGDRLDIYKVNAYERDGTPELLVENGSSPNFAPDRFTMRFAYVRLNGDGLRQVAIWSMNAGRPVALANPTNTAECFAPAFGFDSLSLMYACTQGGITEFYYYASCTANCQTDTQAQRIDLQLGTVEGINASRIGNLAPGPAPRYFAFDDGTNVYFSHLDDNGTWVTAALLSIPGVNLSTLRWTLSIYDTQLE